MRDEYRFNNARRDILLIIVSALVATIPFLHQPHDIDDPFVLHLADNILKCHTDPLAGSSYWFQERGLLAAEFRNPPLAGYLAAPIVFFFNHREVPLHAFFGLWYVLAGLFFYGLARRFVNQGLVVTLIFLFAPPMIVQAHHIMPDMLCVCLFLGGLWAIVRGFEQHEQFWFTLAGLMGGLAPCAKYHGLLWIPVAIMLLWFGRKKKFSLRALCLLLLTSILPFTVWMLWQTRLYGEVHRLAVFSAVEWTPGELLLKLQALITHLGATLPVLLGSFVLVSRSPRRLFFIVASGIMTLASILGSYWRWLPTYSLIATAIFFFLGLLPLFLLFHDSFHHYLQKRRKETRIIKEGMGTDKISIPYSFLSGWFIILFLGTILATPFIASRYLLLSLPPLILLLASHIFEPGIATWGQSIIEHRLRNHVIVWSIVFLGFAISIGDFQFSQMTQRIANAVVSRYTDNTQVLFTGHWGFQYTLEQHGLTAWELDMVIDTGTLIITPNQWSRQRLSEEVLERTTPIERLTVKGRIPITIMDPWQGVGFHYHRGRPVPWLPKCPSEISIDILRYDDPPVPARKGMIN